MATIEKYQISSGAMRYRVRYRTPDNPQTDKRGFITKRDAERFANKVDVDKMRGEYVAPSHARVTVSELGPRGWTASAATSSSQATDRRRLPGDCWSSPVGDTSPSAARGRPLCSSGSQTWVVVPLTLSRSAPVW